jgi:hypothetical protein
VVSYGGQADSYVYPEQSPQDGDWVNSLYARQYDGDFFEAGWYWTPGGSTPVWFTVLRKNGVTQNEERFTVSGVTPGTRYKITVRRSVADPTETYEVYVNNGIKRTKPYTGITSSIPCVGAERYETRDYNKGSWTYVQHFKKLSSGAYQWQYWPGAAVTSASNQDPTYKFWNNKVGASNHYVYVDDHQN